VMGKWALYYYAGDGAPGEANGQGVGGKWYAIDANCTLVKTAA
jgi:predicted lipoprotein with Yx(FWY)xxD motif